MLSLEQAEILGIIALIRVYISAFAFSLIFIELTLTMVFLQSSRKITQIDKKPRTRKPN